MKISFFRWLSVLEGHIVYIINIKDHGCGDPIERYTLVADTSPCVFIVGNTCMMWKKTLTITTHIVSPWYPKELFEINAFGLIVFG